jgi:hypothetical protein
MKHEAQLWKTERHGHVGETPALDSGDSRFKSGPGDILSLLMFIEIFLSSFGTFSRSVSNYILIASIRIFSISLFITYPVIRRYIIRASDSIIKQATK